MLRIPFITLFITVTTAALAFRPGPRHSSRRHRSPVLDDGKSRERGRVSSRAMPNPDAIHA